jgi:hypothetical protein
MVKLTHIFGVASAATCFGQFVWGVATGSFLLGGQVEGLKLEIVNFRRDLSSQNKLFDAQLRLIEYRLNKLEQDKNSSHRK